MKFLINAHVYGWKMTGLMGKNGSWFLGFTAIPDNKERSNSESVPEEKAELQKTGFTVDDQRSNPKPIKRLKVLDGEDDPVRAMVIAAAIQEGSNGVVGEFDGEKLVIKDA